MESIANIVNAFLSKEESEYTPRENPVFSSIFNKPFEEIEKDIKPLLSSCICRKKSNFGTQSIIYRCKTCETNEYSCICEECFRNGNHEGHDYEMQKTIDSFTCDCGNELAWKVNGFCKNHGKKFEGDASQLLPSSYQDIPLKIETLLITIIKFLFNSNTQTHQKEECCSSCDEECHCECNHSQNGINIIGKMLNELSEIYLLFNIFGQLMNKPTSFSIKINGYSYQNLTIGEALFIGCEKQLSEELEHFITSFQSHPRMVHYNSSLLFNFFVKLSFDDQYENGYILNDLYSQLFLQKELSSLFIQDRSFVFYLQTLQQYIRLFKENEIENETLQNNICESLRIINYVFGNSNKIMNKETLIQYLQCLQELSNVEPSLRTKYVEKITLCIIEPLLFPLKITAYYFVDNIDIRYLYEIFNDIHLFVMNHLKNYMINSQQIHFGKSIIHNRIIGINQPISTLSPLLYFYTLILSVLMKNDLSIDISKEDGEILVEYGLMNLVFRHQYENGKWLLTGENFVSNYNLYVTPINYEFVQSDIALVQMMNLIVGPNFIIDTLKWYYNVNIPERKNDEDQQGFICTVIQLIRGFIINSNILKEDLIRIYIIHLMISGITDPDEMSSLVPFFSTDFYSAFNYVMNQTFSGNKIIFNYVDPFFALPIEMSKALLLSTIENKESIKLNRYQVQTKDSYMISPFIHLMKQSICSCLSLIEYIESISVQKNLINFSSSLLHEIKINCDPQIKQRIDSIQTVSYFDSDLI
ncbi:hypothetical protein EDI_156820 [Entamoeba dispar SAW760]|uniref:E3 ubiquitin-protein ligase n=1 Tax=Entamoeba dispar (strain ATCC PRA-260 / SAW760) TaxID=370354 RepID=B0EIR9_ENTDS|nr:uncharacterized protein EDI_156820 [Entamoeba dispar SAW760]EDR25567.1 hypothetical protein EDI_156820 [Entamoeba dispar SAW760]|eukprot:EDR25567.1 hypothetical protein EDI_156820 [Entamoeba dispar SAW760]